MKALLISDNKEIIENVKPVLVKKGFDIISYRWIIKALDNIEEISPDLIVLSPSEFPRHWKTLASFVKSGIGGRNVKIYLYQNEKMTQEEKKKAEELCIFDFFELTKEYTNCTVDFTNPDSKRFVTEKAKHYHDKNLIEFSLPYSYLEKNKIVKHLTIYENGNISSFSAKVVDGIFNNLTFELKSLL